MLGKMTGKVDRAPRSENVPASLALIAIHKITLSDTTVPTIHEKLKQRDKHSLEWALALLYGSPVICFAIATTFATAIAASKSWREPPPSSCVQPPGLCHALAGAK